MIELTENPIETGKIYEQMSHKGVGSLVVHVGVVKPMVEDRKTGGIRLTPEGDPKKEMQKVEQELREKWDILDVLLIRRIGELRVGDVILVAAVAATSRGTAFDACRSAVEVLKEKRGLRKEELYED